MLALKPSLHKVIASAPQRAATRVRSTRTIMGGLFSSPSSEVKNFHELKALDIDKKEVDFNSSAVNGKVSILSLDSQNMASISQLHTS